MCSELEGISLEFLVQHIVRNICPAVKIIVYSFAEYFSMWVDSLYYKKTLCVLLFSLLCHSGIYFASISWWYWGLCWGSCTC